jgi:hypothetical protein
VPIQKDCEAYNEHRVFPAGGVGGGEKRLGCCANHSPPSTAEVANGLELFLLCACISMSFDDLYLS